MKSQRGISLLEMIIVIAITSVVSVALYKILSTSYQIFYKTSALLQKSKIENMAIPFIDDNFIYTKKILEISQSTNTNGYIKFLDDSNVTTSIFLNTVDNQANFQNNAFPTHSVMVYKHQSKDLDLLIQDKVSEFSILSYAEVDTLKGSTVNNVVTPNLDEITSVKFIINNADPNNGFFIERLITLQKARISNSGSIIFGNSEQAPYSYPFNSSHSNLSFTGENYSIVTDASNSNADAVIIPTTDLTVRIKNTGKYFYSIKEALDHAVSGNTVMVSAKSTPYIESLIVPPGVHLVGGYDPIFWVYDPKNNPTTIKTKTTFSDKTIILRNDSSIEGFVIDGASLSQCIYMNNVSNYLIKNCFIKNVRTGIESIRSSGKIINNVVSANHHSIVISDSSVSLNVIRNRLFVINKYQKPNIIINNSQNLLFANNIITNGDSGIDIKNLSLSEFTNNIFHRMDNFGVYALNSSFSITNSIFFQNKVGVFSDLPLVVIQNNLFADNWSHITGLATHANNIVDSNSYNWDISNPYFHDLNNYYYKSGSQLFDNGIGNFDTFLNGAPSYGSNTTDLGIYGGSFAGRVGLPSTTTILNSDANTIISQKIQTSFPGDIILFDHGNFQLSTPISLKNDQYFQTKSLENTFLLFQSSNGILVNRDNSINQTRISAPARTAIVVNNVKNVSIENMIIQNSATGIDLQNNSNTNIFFNTFYQNSNGIKNTASLTNSGYNIFSYITNIGLHNISGTLTSEYNYFHNASARISGTIIRSPIPDIINTPALFLDRSQNLFYHHPSSNTTLSFGNLAANVGAFEHYPISANIKTPFLESNSQRFYKSITLKLFGPAISTVNFAPVRLEFGYMTKSQQFMFDGYKLITNNNIQELVVTLPVTTISNKISFHTYIYPYKHHHSPYIDSLKLQW